MTSRPSCAIPNSHCGKGLPVTKISLILKEIVARATGALPASLGFAIAKLFVKSWNELINRIQE